MPQVTSAQEVAYLRSIVATSSNPTEVAAAKGILAGLDQIPPGPQQQQEVDAYLAQVLNIAPGSDLTPSQMDQAIDAALINFANANVTLSSGTSDLSALSPDDLFAILAKAAINAANGELRNAESQREAAYQLAQGAAEKQASDLRSEADTIESGALTSLIFTCAASAVEIAGAVASLGQSLGAAGAEADAGKAANPADAAQFTAAATRFNARASLDTHLASGAAGALSATGNFLKATYDARAKRLEADSASAAGQGDIEKQLASHMDSIVQQVQNFNSSMIQYLQGYQQAQNDALRAATRA